MRGSSIRRAPLIGVFGALLLLTAACTPIVWAPVGGTSCPVGTFTLDHTEVSSALSTPIGNVTVSVDPGTVNLTIGGGTWNLSGDETLTVSGNTSYGAIAGTIAVDGAASGTYSVGSGKITFVLSSISGTASFAGTVGGTPVSQSFNLAQVGQLTALYGLSGSVPFSCPASGELVLTFPSFVHRF